MAIPKSFRDCLAVKSPLLQVRFDLDPNDPVIPVDVEHYVGKRPSLVECAWLDSFADNPKMAGFLTLYRRHNGVEICRVFDSLKQTTLPLLKFVQVGEIDKLTRSYHKSGVNGWTIDFNKTANLYRRSNGRWIVFAGGNGGVLSLFVTGKHAGSVFLIQSEPRFNTLRPIAKSFDELLERIGRDLPAFLRLIGAMVTMRGPDRVDYGLRPVGYGPKG